MIPAYRLKDVSYSYGDQTVIDIRELEIPQGEIVALIGPNGSGKTTLLHLLAFLEVPHSGEISFFGEEFRQKDVLALRRKVGLLLQNPYLFHETVLSNMLWGLRLRGISSRQAQHAAVKALETVGLGGFEHRYARSLSGGESQRVALARALVLEPSVLLLDEPSNHMDKQSAEQAEHIVLELNRTHGKTIVVATHAVDRFLTLAHRVFHMWEGKAFPAAPENLFRGVLRERGLVFDTGNISVHLATPATGGNVMTIDASQIDITLGLIEPVPVNVFPGTVVSLCSDNGKVRVEVEAGERLKVLVASAHEILPQLRLGGSVTLMVRPRGIRII